MQKEITLWQRFMSDTPLFFRKAQLFGIGLAGLGTSLSQVSGMPSKLTTIQFLQAPLLQLWRNLQ